MNESNAFTQEKQQQNYTLCGNENQEMRELKVKTKESSKIKIYTPNES